MKIYLFISAVFLTVVHSVGQSIFNTRYGLGLTPFPTHISGIGIRTKSALDIHASLFRKFDNNLQIGIDYNKGINIKNMEGADDIHEFGAHLRYYIPIFNDKALRQVFTPYLHLRHLQTNEGVTYMDGWDLTYFGKSNFLDSKTQLHVGVSCHLHKNLFLNLSAAVQWLNFSSRQEAMLYTLEYHFGKSGTHNSSSDISLVSLSNPVIRELRKLENQYHFGDRLTIGGNYFWYKNQPDNADDVTIDNGNRIGLNIALSLHPRWDVGMQYIRLKTDQYLVEQVQYFNKYGVFVQWKPITFGSVKPYTEVSLNRSDFLPLYFNDFSSQITRKSGIYDLGMGAGLEIPLIKKWLSLDLAFFNYHIINRIEHKTNDTQLVVGLNVHFKA